MSENLSTPADFMLSRPGLSHVAGIYTFMCKNILALSGFHLHWELHKALDVWTSILLTAIRVKSLSFQRLVCPASPLLLPRPLKPQSYLPNDHKSGAPNDEIFSEHHYHHFVAKALAAVVKAGAKPILQQHVLNKQ